MAATVCGTGGWSGPVAGDPDTSNLILTATPAFGGIDLNWTYPMVNPNAVAYTIVYRSLLADPDTAQFLVNAAGSFYYDKTDVSAETVYYYWIRMVSINGTVGDLIGPAWAHARPLIRDLIEQLTGQIDAGVLAQSLKTPIDQIQLNKLAITQEMLDRDAADATYGVMLNEIRGDLGKNTALLQQEVLARVTADQSFVSTVNTLYSTFNTSIAAVQQEQSALATAQEATAKSILTVQSKLNSDLASVQVNLNTTITKVGDKVTAIGALYTAKVDVNGLIGGFGVYNDGKFVEAGFDVDRFWVGRTKNKVKPFIIENDEVFIDQARINYLIFSKLRDEAGSVIVEGGKLKAQYIQADRLDVRSAANFYGNVTFSQVTGLTDYLVRMNSWVRPDTTLISGNAIYTGDAYVDTLQIKGNAITVPSFAQAFDTQSSTTWVDVLTLTVTLDVAGWLYASSSGYIAYGSGFGDTSTRLIIEGQQVSFGGGTESWVSATHSGAAYLEAGTHTVSLQFQSPSGKGRIITRSLFAMAVQR